MEDRYKYDQVGTDKIISTLMQTRTKYKDQITSLENLAREILASPAWKDLKVKTEFINTFDAYLNIYKDAHTAMERYEKYLEKKSKTANQIEQNYMR